VSAKVQRLRVTYARGPQLRFVSHLDMMRFWERALRRAKLPVSYSEGFTPHAQIALGAPLSVGMTGRAELLDVFLHEVVSPEEFRGRLQQQVPAGVALQSVSELSLAWPAIQAQLRSAEYEIALRSEADVEAAAARIDALLASESFPWEHRREKDTKRYDLRPLVMDLRLERRGESSFMIAHLRAEEAATGRPDQLAAALGLAHAVAAIERVRLVLAEPVGAVESATVGG
jgi:radical SAM-linked protein